MTTGGMIGTTTIGTGGARAGVDLAPIPGASFRMCVDLEADLPGMWAAQDAARVADGELQRTTLEGMRAYYRHLERFDAGRDLLIAEADGRIVWSARRLTEVAAAHAAAGTTGGRPRAFTTFLFDGDRRGRTLLEGAGYTAFRRFASMTRPDLDDLPEVALPDGLVIRTIGRDRAAMRRVFDADIEAFRDHFGLSDGSDERFAEFLEDPDVDPDLWQIAFDGDEVAGGILNGIHVSPEGARSGWLDSIFTRRPWRRRGLARALIARSLALLHDRGLAAASLGVDLANPHQALALYESSGFRVVSSATFWRKPLPERVEPEEVP